MGKKILTKKLIIHIALVLVSVACIYPFFWIIANTFKTDVDIIKRENLIRVLVPVNPHFDNYYNVLVRDGFFVYIFNSFIYTAISVSLGVFLGTMISYAIAFHKFPFKNAIYIGIILFMMVPMPGLFIPQYVVIGQFHLMNTRLGLILPFASGLIPLTVFIVKGFMESFPYEIIEAAKIDGCNKWKMLYNIVTPMTKPAIATVSILHVSGVWNEWLLPSLVVTDNKLYTIQAGLMKYQAQHTTEYALLMTGLVISMLPLMLLFLSLQKFVITGISSGALKG